MSAFQSQHRRWIDEALIENRLMRETKWSQSYRTTFVFSVSRLLSRRCHSISAIPGHCAWLTMPSVDFRYAMGSPCGSLSSDWDTQRISRGKEPARNNLDFWMPNCTASLAASHSLNPHCSPLHLRFGSIGATESTAHLNPKMSNLFLADP